MPKLLGLQKKNECRNFIRNHHGKMSNIEMSRQLKVGLGTLVRMIRELKLAKVRMRKPHVVITHGKTFNVNLHQNWLTGIQ